MNYEFPANERVRLTLAGQGVAHVVLARGDKLNALDPALLESRCSICQAALPGASMPTRPIR